HAFHSAMMQPAADAFAAIVASVERRVPQRKFISNVTGTWITAEQATSPEYWASHLLKPVRFADGAQELLTDPARVFVEVGPGATRATAVGQKRGAGKAVVVAPRRHPRETKVDQLVHAGARGGLW